MWKQQSATRRQTKQARTCFAHNDRVKLFNVSFTRENLQGC